MNKQSYMKRSSRKNIVGFI